MTYTDALAQIGQIQAHIASLSGAFAPSAAPQATGGATAPGATTPGATTSFATQLAQAQAPAQTSAIGTPGLTGTPGMMQPASVTASGPLTSGQQQFATRLAADTGLSPQVVGAWLLAEESGGAATTRQSANNNDWLNIGYTDTGTYGAADSVWSDPIAAADATAGWLHGQNTIPGYGTASGGIQAILATAGQSPQAQVSAIQQSGWASSGYPNLPALLSQVGG
jgi:hypothetical protein